ncbi:pre-mRNA-splicing factor Slu7-like [Leptopilina boulardi]|uniref:pre-mRNA-splicing factor Slu7-like n=1 Tax=Leptopilina boulardi TaxID=63433 RepID=UPI0021F5C0FD|nr:pre-mRNA-splicing factor Slu7-like [Leptopilina boulardi]
MANPLANVPVSQILKNKSQFEDEPKKKSRDDWRKAKELEEARKAGTAPAAVDEEGKDINPHIPQYISTTPWYFDAQGPTLKHQRPQPERQKQFSGIDDWYIRGQQQQTNRAVKYRKGACENCGAMGHKRKECFERPRKLLAKFSQTQLASDDVQQPDLSLDYDAKRDRWAGYDPSEHREIVEEYQKIEEAKKEIRAEKLNAGEIDDQDSDKDEDKYVDEIDMPGTKVDSKQRITVRNLRIREDTAKYLRNLDPNSAYYDPKTRSMRDNPYAGTDREVDYQGENFTRFTGDTQEHATAQLFAWEASGRGLDVHLLAEPTKLELLKKEYDKNRSEQKNKSKNRVIEKYGGEEHLDVPPAPLLLAQTEEYVEYNRAGKIIKGQERQVIRSKYEEDIIPGNHSSVWGSFWRDGKWGFKCCHSFIKNSYCTGESGKLAADVPIIVQSTSNEKIITQQASSSTVAEFDEKNANDDDDKEIVQKHDSSDSSLESDSSNSNSDIDTRTVTEKKTSNKEKKMQKKRKRKEKLRMKKKMKTESKLQEALRKEEESQREGELMIKLGDRNRSYNSMYEAKEPTAEEIEAFQIKRSRVEDPMAHFKN